MTRDRRWDFLYDREKQPVKEWVLERLADELARDVSGWPPPLAWTSEELRTRFAAALAERPREAVLRRGLELARRDLERDLEGYEQLSAEGVEHRTPGEQAALQLVARFVCEKCLSLKEEAEGVRLSRADLAAAVTVAERRLFRVTER